MQVAAFIPLILLSIFVGCAAMAYLLKVSGQDYATAFIAIAFFALAFAIATITGWPF